MPKKSTKTPADHYREIALDRGPASESHASADHFVKGVKSAAAALLESKEAHLVHPLFVDHEAAALLIGVPPEVVHSMIEQGLLPQISGWGRMGIYRGFINELLALLPEWSRTQWTVGAHADVDEQPAAPNAGKRGR